MHTVSFAVSFVEHKTKEAENPLDLKVMDFFMVCVLLEYLLYTMNIWRELNLANKHLISDWRK